MLLALRKVEEEAISFVFFVMLVLAGEEVTRFPLRFSRRVGRVHIPGSLGAAG